MYSHSKELIAHILLSVRRDVLLSQGSETSMQPYQPTAYILDDNFGIGGSDKPHTISDPRGGYKGNAEYLSCKRRYGLIRYGIKLHSNSRSVSLLQLVSPPLYWPQNLTSSTRCLCIHLAIKIKYRFVQAGQYINIWLPRLGEVAMISETCRLWLNN
jgi:hypothetical protein